MRSAIVLLLLAAAGPAFGQTTFHGNNARTGAYEGPGPERLDAARWTFATGGPVVASPVVAGGMVYVASLSGFLYAVDRATGQEKWRFKSRTPIASTPPPEPCAG